ncbi:MAG: Abortive infection protein [Bacillota bacterium]|nr:MAG: Abortive infection protein [Bacillota bacterium]MBS3951144.1 CPBP family intramembrane metalloprotease [Peptococcaceae bacterium]
MRKNRVQALLKVLLIVPASFVVIVVLSFAYNFISGILFALDPSTFTTDLAYMLTSLGFVVTVYLFWTLWDKRPFQEMGFEASLRKTLVDFAAGSMLGVVIILLSVIVSLTLGFGSFVGRAQGGVTWDVLMGLMVYLSVGIAEEILSRGYMMTVMAQSFGSIFAIIGSAVIFSALHLLNPNLSILSVINIVLAGILLAFSYYRTKALWFPIGLHFTWNLMQGTIFSLEVSGRESMGLFHILLSGPEYITGGKFGLEGGLIFTLLTLLAFVAVEFYARKTAQSA